MLSGLVTSKIVTSKNDEILTKITNHFSRSKFPSKVVLQTVLFWFWIEFGMCLIALGWLSLNCVKNTRRSLNDMIMKGFVSTDRDPIRSIMIIHEF